MQMIVYIDIYFIINFIADYIIITLSFFDNKPNISRRIFSSLTGSLYACLYFFNVNDLFFSWYAKLFVLFLMAFIVCYPCRIKKLFESTFLLLITSAFISGIIFAISITNGSYFNEPYRISDLILIFGISAGYLIITLSKKMFKRKSVTNEYFIKIFYNKNNVTLWGVVDTGNALKDPLSGKPVIIADNSVLKNLISPHITEANLCEFVRPEDFRVIPYKTISQSGVIYGFTPDKVEIKNQTVKDVIIAQAPIHLEADALLNPLLI